MKKQLSSTERFSHTVDYYRAYRPSYPQALIDFLLEKKIISSMSTVADIGSGTGLLTELLLKTGAHVYAVEPNDEMRQVAETALKDYKNFVSVKAVAENTTLKDKSIDLITAATAFHWFDLDACQIEFKRILKSEAWVALIWNLRSTEHSPMLEEYDLILKKHCPEYKGVSSRNVTKEHLESFFRKGSLKIEAFDYQQSFDEEGLIGRLRSSSYALTPDQKGYEAMIAEIKTLFKQYSHQGKVIFPYITKTYYGKLG